MACECPCVRIVGPLLAYPPVRVHGFFCENDSWARLSLLGVAEILFVSVLLYYVSLHPLLLVFLLGASTTKFYGIVYGFALVWSFR